MARPPRRASSPAMRTSTTASIADARIGIGELDTGEDLGEVDVGRLDRVGAGRERDVLESVRRTDGVDLRMEDASLGRGRIRGVRRRRPVDHVALLCRLTVGCQLSRVYQRPRRPEGCATAVRAPGLRPARSTAPRASARTRRRGPGRAGRRGSARSRCGSRARRPRDGRRRATSQRASSCSWEQARLGTRP